MMAAISAVKDENMSYNNASKIFHYAPYFTLPHKDLKLFFFHSLLILQVKLQVC